MNLPDTQIGAVEGLARRALARHKAAAKSLGQVLDYTAADLVQLVEANPCCRWCRLPVGFDLHLDHLHPIARGGKFALYNLCVSCSRCNRLKGCLTGAEMEFLREFLDGLHPSAREDIERRLLAGGKRYASRGDKP
jgi:5-methylcytosine-specific restriction endonuclease McrA